MDWLNEMLLQCTHWLKPHTAQVAVALVATFLVIYGNTINRMVRLFVKPYHFVLRVGAFVLLCTLGYGALTVWGVNKLKQLIATLPDLYFAPTILLAFIILGILAERYHKN